MVGTVAAVFLMLLVLLLLFSPGSNVINANEHGLTSNGNLLVAQHIRANRTCDQSTDST
ncbi:hypothetical protein BU25DRAFT_414533 [Macroventuria anomochaeta]|uniref:Uncharacterized protein n=1 Tax=Macroventuria anomochaeta TaxID=301207 RepID=A0ACB6RQ55_9PLEO|nr:uncharacterized protein BU25DRAFT_414533 [Macroventuria anomochaeta]KAF2623279.1 hypothetical protein BU25DRAFT_414533 [Macroventuria anomochaeta]